MATELIMPSVNTQPGYGFYERPQHHRSQSYQIPQRGVNYTGVSSLSSSNSSGNSPTSPKAYHTRQARPLFMPAALRPNEFPSKPIPTPKSSVSEDSTPVGSLTRSNTSLFGFAGSAVSRLTRRSTGDSGKAFEEDEDELDVDMFPDVTALPTKQHWKVRELACAAAQRCLSLERGTFRDPPPESDGARLEAVSRWLCLGSTLEHASSCATAQHPAQPTYRLL